VELTGTEFTIHRRGLLPFCLQRECFEQV